MNYPASHLLLSFGKTKIFFPDEIYLAMQVTVSPLMHKTRRIVYSSASILGLDFGVADCDVGETSRPNVRRGLGSLSAVKIHIYNVSA